MSLFSELSPRLPARRSYFRLKNEHFVTEKRAHLFFSYFCVRNQSFDTAAR